MSLKKTVLLIGILTLSGMTKLLAQDNSRQAHNRTQLYQFLGSKKVSDLLIAIDTLKRKSDSLANDLEWVKRRESQTISSMAQAFKYARLFGNPENTDTGRLKANADTLALQYRIETGGRISFDMIRDVAGYFFGFHNDLPNKWPLLEKLKYENKVTVEVFDLVYGMAPGTQVPQIAIPQFASVAGAGPGQRSELARRYMDYISDLFNRYHELDPVILKDYKKYEKQHVPDNNPDKLIEMRKRFIIFMKENASDIMI